MGKGDMSISAFARRSLLSVKALRLYDEMGLLRPERIDPSSRYRYYGESQLETARFISLLRKLEVPLATITEIVETNQEQAMLKLDEWWQREEERLERRRDLLCYVRGSVLSDESASIDNDTYDVAIRERPEITYLYRSSHLHGPDLPAFIGNSIDILTDRARLYGGAKGYSVVIFHGVVDLDSDGPADVCLPISNGSTAQGDDLIRTEAAHQQAYIALRKHQVEFPQILQVYQSLKQWIELHGHAISGPPREQYLGAFDAASPNEDICEIAFPIHLQKDR